MKVPPPAERPQRLTIVLAQWCPHCVPLSVENGERLAKRLGVPLRLLDIDKAAEVKIADRMVREHGDLSPDYLIPQVFLEMSNGRVEHLLTGFSESVVRTRRAWGNLLSSARVASLVREARA